MAYIKPTEQTRKIHQQIVFVCKYLRTLYTSKKHGGYNIYADDKIYLCTDTYVPNVDCSVVLPDGAKENVFSSPYSSSPSIYHSGAWEVYLEELFENARKEKEKLDIVEEKQDQAKQKEIEHPASSAADNVFA